MYKQTTIKRHASEALAKSLYIYIYIYTYVYLCICIYIYGQTPCAAHLRRFVRARLTFCNFLFKCCLPMYGRSWIMHVVTMGIISASDIWVHAVKLHYTCRQLSPTNLPDSWASSQPLQVYVYSVGTFTPSLSLFGLVRHPSSPDLNHDFGCVFFRGCRWQSKLKSTAQVDLKTSLSKHILDLTARNRGWALPSTPCLHRPQSFEAAFGGRPPASANER
jgi:hypothetical protein